MKTFSYLLLGVICTSFLVSPIFAQQIDVKADERIITIDFKTISTQLQQATSQSRVAQNQGITISLPLTNGIFEQFEAIESTIMEPALAAQLPYIKTYSFKGINDPLKSGRLTLNKETISGVILDGKQITYIEPITPTSTQYRVHHGQKIDRRNIDCSQHEEALNFGQLKNSRLAQPASTPPFTFSNGTTKKTFRLAIMTTTAFYSNNGGNDASVNGVIVTIVNNLVAIYERDLAVTFTLLTPFNNQTVTYKDLAAAHTQITANYTSSGFDIGQVFHHETTINSGSGVASLGVVCAEGSKGSGWSGANPSNGSLLQSILYHEVAHQFNASHSFSGQGGSCTASLSAASAYEPGSGSTIMSYAGVCDASDNIIGFPDTYFHIFSLDQMISFVGTISCNTSSVTGNAAPVIGTLSNYTIPRNTPFTLTGNATDANGDALTYCWEQLDLAAMGDYGLLGAEVITSTTAPLFRSFSPTTSPSITYPSLTYILNNDNTPTANTLAQHLPNVGRTINFQLTVRDNRSSGGAMATKPITLTVDGSSGPFKVTYQDSGTPTIAAPVAVTVSWNVSGTSGAPINCANVKISLSTDGGNTFGYILASSTPNNGSAIVTIPNVVTTLGRIKVEAIGNIFFDINNANIIITSTCGTNNKFSSVSSLNTTAGNALLNLSLTPLIGNPITSTAITLDNSLPSASQAAKNSVGGACVNTGFSFRYATQTFGVLSDGSVSFSLPDFSGVRALNLYQTSYSSAAPCTNWLNSNTVFTSPGSFNFSSPFSNSLAAGTLYVMDYYTVSVSLPVTTTLTISPGVYTTSPSSGFVYKYIVVNGAGNVAEITAANTSPNMTAYVAGTYQVYGMVVATAANTAPYVGGTFTNLQTNLLNATLCGIQSDNQKTVTITAPLPVELISFTGKEKDNKAELTWRTNTEKNTDNFELERSEDVRFFEKIGELKAKGESLVQTTYQFTDESPKDGINYYRLKMNDLDNSYQYSRVISITIGTSEEDVLISPNPTDWDNIQLLIKNNSGASIRLFNTLGNEILIQKAQQGKYVKVFPQQKIPSGLYLLLIQTERADYAKKLLIE